MSNVETQVDTSGQACPVPVLLTRRGLKKIESGQVLEVIGDFFPLIEKRSWTKAEELLEEMRKDNSSTDWMLGYLLALGGMISALKEGGSIEPYIFSLKRCNYQQLQEEQNGFNEFNKLLAPKKDFDAAYFQAWNDLTYYMMNSKI